MSLISKPSLSNVGKYAMNTLGGFRAFILRGNVVDLAVGIVIGAAFTSVVNAFVTDIITPIIPAGNTSLSTWNLDLPYGRGLPIGHFINAVISFLIVAAVLYFFIVRPISALLDRYKPQKVEVAMQECPFCLQDIPVKATRCAFCTSVLAEAQPN